jgi:FKBP-type peptidyl-prolyl cis-trans isomerase
MTSIAPRRSQTLLLSAVASAVVLALAVAAYAQQPPATGSSPTDGPANETAKKPASPAPTKSTESYSFGLLAGAQLHDMGISPADMDSERFQAGVRDGISGKAVPGQADRENVTALVRGVHDRALEANHGAAAKFLAENSKKPGVVTTASGLQYKVLKEGSGTSPKASDTVVVNYRGTLLDGKEFDSSYSHGEPATFPVGGVIPGWTEALQLMKPGAKYQLWIPPALAYDQGRPGIPPGSLLAFDVELLKVQPKAAAAAPTPPRPAPPQK